LADYRARNDDFAAAGFGIVALAVDEPTRSEGLRRAESLPFPILCDTERAVVKEWDLYNAREKGGIAVPATFVLDGERRVRFASVDDVRHRVTVEDVLAFVRGGAASGTRATLAPGRAGWMRAVGNWFRYGVTSPRKKS
jgi:peroxiredoxin